MIAKSIPVCWRQGLRIVAAIVLLALAEAKQAAADAETDAFNGAVAAAHRHYREAVYYIETGSLDLGAIALEDFLVAWKTIVERYGAKPPPGYAGDPDFPASLNLIAGKAASAVGAAPAEALLALRDLRGDFGVMRQRSGQVVFSDCVDAMNAAFDRLWAFRRSPPDPARTRSVAAYRAALAETERTYRRCRDAAPPALRDDAEFQRLIQGALASLEKLAAVDAANRETIESILRELHSYDRLLWLRFG